ncbi:MAG: dihydropteroate synthase [Actinobacteria bacterium]|nr:dihydropteroate synthase [Actinomycetota bacterium]
MGILNATPDSFSGDGVGFNADVLVRRLDQILAEGPDILDVGGESTRPGGPAVEVEEELRRVLPVLSAVRARSTLPVSIDTRRAEVARAALAHGADLINDVSGLAFDPAMLGVVAQAGVPVVLTHSRRGEVVHTPRGTHDAGVAYGDLVAEIAAEVGGLVARAVAQGVARDRIIWDPGFGFGKSPSQNIELLRRLAEFRPVGLPMLVGLSRKSFIGRILAAPVTERLEGSLAAAVLAVAKGADIVRAHDVGATRRALAVADAIVRARADD